MAADNLFSPRYIVPMQFTDTAVIVRLDPYGEQDALVSAFGRQQGLIRGMARRAFSSKQRGIFCLGNTIELEWSARLEEHLGNLKAELLAPGGAVIMGHRQRCYALQAMCALISMSFEQRDPHPAMFKATELLVESMRFDLPWQADYARFEAILLRETGFGLGLERCIASGNTQNLAYISPKSGCAVSAEAGAPYAQKMLPFAPLLLEEMHVKASPEAVQSALKVTGFFLERWLCAAHEKQLPDARGRLMRALGKEAEAV